MAIHLQLTSLVTTGNALRENSVYKKQKQKSSGKNFAARHLDESQQKNAISKKGFHWIFRTW